jgi:hypothetical protein
VKVRSKHRFAGHTRWRRFAALLVPAVFAGGAMLAFTAQGVLAASFAVSGQNFKLSANKLEAEGFAQYGAIDTEVNGKHHPVAPVGIKSAKLSDLCQSVLIPTPFGAMTLRLTAGGDTPITASNLVVDADQLGGNATFTDIQIGVDASKLDEAPGHTGPAGQFGQQAKKVSLDHLRMRAWAATAGTFNLNDLSMSATFGDNECY